ncbi:hypothetical protein M011DRAFT_469796 [Sporormia fimetaria CBS 119925]|uniref:Oxidoreductase-like domain-containing protein n=1 Tax=Sporormia fimetaria CBS 119925 TaxID=1340428 RepID=A0A6A6V5T9_9PLEO|nr:hypothetical protein M011DRAFT_469796 [Sporormia fimetaria CBS 119925]
MNHIFTLRQTSTPLSRRLWTLPARPDRKTRIGLQNSNRIHCRRKGHIAEPGSQANPLEGFYAELMSSPLKQMQSATPTAPSPPPPEFHPNTRSEEALQKHRAVFGSREEVAAERKAKAEAATKEVAGVLVPPRPTEPDNCCMSGCVNCVWDMYRDEMEEWVAKSAEARAALQAQKGAGTGTGTMSAAQGAPSHVATSMDDDGGGSETNWVGDGGAVEHLFDDIPVGIREFMKTEKKLKQMHKEQNTTGG